jgi:hypothetical protein
MGTVEDRATEEFQRKIHHIYAILNPDKLRYAYHQLG